jgi:hypothetical protein
LNERNFLIEMRALLLSAVALLETYLEIKPSTTELRKKGQEYVTLMARGSLDGLPVPPPEKP